MVHGEDSDACDVHAFHGSQSPPHRGTSSDGTRTWYHNKFLTTNSPFLDYACSSNPSNV
jgi:hypothetical protein